MRRLIWYGLSASVVILGIFYLTWYYHWGDPSFSAENPGVSGGAIDGILIDYKLSELITSADKIVIGEVGPILARDYPRKYQLEGITPAKLADYGVDSYIYEIRDIYHSIIVEETIRGEHQESFVLVRPDVDYFAKIDISKLLEGEQILLFALDFHDVEYITNQFEQIYWSLGDNAIFDIDDQDRAFPRNPEAFIDVYSDTSSTVQDTIPVPGTSNSTPSSPIREFPEDNLNLIVDEPDLDPYINLNKLIIEIEKVIEKVGDRSFFPLKLDNLD